jgi:hypothetical protein
VKPYQDKNPENDIKPVVTEHYSEDSVEGINLLKKKKETDKGVSGRLIWAKTHRTEVVGYGG